MRSKSNAGTNLDKSVRRVFGVIAIGVVIALYFGRSDRVVSMQDAGSPRTSEREISCVLSKQGTPSLGKYAGALLTVEHGVRRALVEDQGMIITYKSGATETSLKTKVLAFREDCRRWGGVGQKP